MDIKSNYSLKKYNTFNVDAKAKFYVEVKSLSTLKEVLSDEKFKNEKKYFLGGGSNILILNDLDGIVIKISLEGITKVSEYSTSVLFDVLAGENWHEFVKYVVDQGLFGAENLALIPGTVGAAVAQNIAAYGQNLDDIFESLEAINTKTLEIKKFSKSECKFEYRSSIFKGNSEWIVLSAILKLSKQGNIETNFHDRYVSLEGELKEIATPPYTVKDIFNAVISIRNKKLPKVEDYGTCGSFFVNPIVSAKRFEELSKIISELQRYPVEKLLYNIKDWEHLDPKEEYVKIPAGRLLDELGWKGKWIGNVGTFDKHALCVVTNKKASGSEILDFVNQMKKSVKDAYDIDLKSEIIILE